MLQNQGGKGMKNQEKTLKKSKYMKKISKIMWFDIFLIDNCNQIYI